MGLLLQGGSANIADVQFEGGAGNKTVVIPKEGGKLALGTMLSGVTAYHLLQGDLTLTTQANKFETTTTTTFNYTISDYVFCYADNKLYDCILASTIGILLTNTTYFTPISGGALSINNAIIPFANGVDSSGTKVSTISKNETITGLTYTAGKNYVYALENGTYGVKPYRPRYLRSDLVADKAGDNPDYFDVLSNTWYSTVANPELVTNGTFTSGTTGWTATNATLSVFNGTLLITTSGATFGIAGTTITTEVGKRYNVSLAYNEGTSSLGCYIMLSSTSISDTSSDVYNGVYDGSQNISFEFIATSTTTYFKLINRTQTSGVTNYFDNISVYATDLALNAPITARNYLDTIAYADASGQLTYVEELPKTQYFDRIETGSNRKVMYLADYGISAIQVNKRYVLDNPFGNDRYMDCDTKLEIYDAGVNKWIEVGHSMPDSASGTSIYGAKSFSTISGIVIQTAIHFLTDGGSTYFIVSEDPSGALTSAPARVIIQFNGKTGRTR